MKTYTKPKMIVIDLPKEDIFTTSGPDCSNTYWQSPQCNGNTDSNPWWKP